VNDPNPSPSLVFESEITGFSVVLQQIPLVKTGEPPSLTTVPPPVAVFLVISVISFVVTFRAAGP
jgi:hypothetical protein